MNRKTTILIVDDNPNNLELMKAQLHSLQVDFKTAQNGPEAIRILGSTDISLAIVDIQLPGMEGFEITEYIRKNQNELQLPVILITAVYNDARYLLKGYQSGAVDYIVRPVTKNVLLSKVKIFLNISQKTRDISNTNLKLEQELELRTRRLQVSEESFKAIFNNTLAGFYRINRDGDILMLNPAAHSILGLEGYDPKVNIHLKMSFFRTEKSQQMFNLEMAMKGETKGLETQWKKLGGELIHVKEYARIITDELGETTHIEGVFNDITLQMQSQNLLDLQKNLGYELLNISSPADAARVIVANIAKIEGIDVAGFYTYDMLERKLLLLNSFGLSDNFIKLASEYDHTTEQFQLMVSGNVVHHVIEEMPLGRRENIQHEGIKDLFSIPFRWEKQLLGVINFASRKTEKIPELSIQTILACTSIINESLQRILFYNMQHESHQNFLNLYDSIDDYIFVLNLQGNILEVNRSVVQTLGYSKADLLGQSVLTVHPPEMRSFAADVVANMINGNERVCTIPLLNNRGEHIPVETRITEGFWNGEKALIGISRDMTARMEQEKLLKFRLDFETLMTKTGAKFVNLSYLKTDQAISETLQETGQFLDVDRSYVFLLHSNQLLMDNTHEWCNQGIEPQIENLKNLPLEIFPWWIDQMKHDTVINFYDIDLMPTEAENEKNILKAQDIKSIIIVPLTFDSKLMGFVGFDAVKQKKHFNDDTEKMLRVAAGYLSSALEHKRKSMALDDYHRNLEIKVAQRTADLKEANLKLKTEIQVRKDVERELRKLTVAIEQSDTAVIITDIVGNIEYINPATTNITGFTRDQLVGKQFWLLAADQRDEKTNNRFWDTILSGKSWIGEMQDYKADHTQIKIKLSITPIRNSKGIITSFIALYEDITKQKQMEGMVIHSQKMEAIGLLASGIAHDFNNLLQVIKVYSDIIKLESNHNDAIIKNTFQIDSAVDRGNKTIKALLNYSRNISPEKGVINLSQVLINFIQVIKSIMPQTIEITGRIARDLHIVGDSVKIEQMVMNLAMNAKDAMKNTGNLSISLTSNKKTMQLPGLPKAKYAMLSIGDEGIGMDEMTLEHIFDPYFTTKAAGQGTGLGLSVVAAIIENHQGFVEVKSQPDKGSRFDIYLPLSEKDNK